MKNKQKVQKLNKRNFVFFSLLILLIFVGFFVVRNNNSVSSQGQTYIINLESADVSSVKKKVQKKRKKERKEAIESGKVDYTSVFDDYVVLGDSRAVGFESYGVLDSSRVLADVGTNVQNVDSHLEEIKALKPSMVILSFGLNDMEGDLDSLKGGYGAVYAKEIKKVLKIVPDAKIYVLSILPVTSSAISNSPPLSNISHYNKALKKMCKKYHWVYVDGSNLIDDDSIYEGDGIHFKGSFYDTWTKYIAQSIMDNED